MKEMWERIGTNIKLGREGKVEAYLGCKHGVCSVELEDPMPTEAILGLGGGCWRTALAQEGTVLQHTVSKQVILATGHYQFLALTAWEFEEVKVGRMLQLWALASKLSNRLIRLGKLNG